MKFLICVAFFVLLAAAYGQKRPDLCLLPEYPPSQKIMCQASLPRYRYDDQTGRCVKFSYGGCGGTANRFGTLIECVETCKASNTLNLPARCVQAHDAGSFAQQETGKCNKKFNEFYFDKVTRKCKAFVYNGCGGSENRFGTMFECKETCELDI